MDESPRGIFCGGAARRDRAVRSLGVVVHVGIRDEPARIAVGSGGVIDVDDRAILFQPEQFPRPSVMAVSSPFAFPPFCIFAARSSVHSDAISLATVLIPRFPLAWYSATRGKHQLNQGRIRDGSANR